MKKEKLNVDKYCNISLQKAFTLVELIVVITILAILATIGFMSFQSYMGDARDANRTTSIDELRKGLSLYEIKKSSYPEPDSAIQITNGTATGVILKQGTIGKNISDLIKMTSKIEDPLTKKEYVYSVSNNGKYYQIGADLENTISYNTLVNTTYAEGNKAYVKGNYSFDPSLPSLITISGSINTSSGIFDPNVCFVLDGGTNLISSTNTNCTPKKDMSLKDFDSSLVGYWDMETGNGDTIYDLSGNNHHGYLTGKILNGAVVTTGTNLYNSGLTTNIPIILPNKVDGHIGKAYNFSGGYIAINPTQAFTGIDWPTNNITITAISKINGVIDDNIGCEFGNGLGNVYYNGTITSPIFSAYRYNLDNYLGRFPTGVTQNGIDRWKNAEAGIIKNFYDNTYSIITFTKNINTLNFYINGVKVNSSIRTDPSLPGYLFDGIYIGATHHCSIYTNTRSIGTIDDVKIYNRALSDEEIAQQAKIAGF